MNHAMPSASLSYLAALLAGLAGSVHCLAMCGGISGALSLRARGQGRAALQLMLDTATYQCGRLVSYTLAGGLIGAAAGAMPSLLHNETIIVGMRAAAGLVLIGAAIGVLSTWRPLAQLERFGVTIWRHLAPLTRALPAHQIRGKLLLGMLWGWLPCGMVYSMLMVAALSGSAARGAVTMLSFGLGTLPAVFFAGFTSAQLLRIPTARRVRATLGVLLLIFGIVTTLAPWGLSAHTHL